MQTVCQVFFQVLGTQQCTKQQKSSSLLSLYSSWGYSLNSVSTKEKKIPQRKGLGMREVGGGIGFLNIWEALSEKVTSEENPERDEGGSQADI